MQADPKIIQIVPKQNITDLEISRIADSLKNIEKLLEKGLIIQLRR